MTIEISLVDHRDDLMARTIAEEEQEELLKISKKKIAPYNSKAKEILSKNNLYIKNGQLVGSSHFIKFHLDPIMRENFGKRAINFDDAGIMQTNNSKALENIYIDLDLGLYSIKGSNAYHAKKLAEQLKELDWNGKLPVRIDGLETIEDKNSDEGLTFKVGENTVWKHAPYLSSENNMGKFTRFGKEGIEFDSEGKYTFYAGSKGLVGFCLDGDGNLTCDDDLTDSDPDGRVFWTEVAKPLAKK